MSAICPLKVQKLAEKRNNQFFVNCRKTALLCDFWNIWKLCKMRGGIFKNYMYANTRFDTPSKSKHGFGSIYEVDGQQYLKLNVQIRFVK